MWFVVAGIGDPGCPRVPYDITAVTDPGYSAVDKVFTDTRIHRAPDCAITRGERKCIWRDAISSSHIVGPR
jgi:hypothetical protein